MSLGGVGVSGDFRKVEEEGESDGEIRVMG